MMENISGCQGVGVEGSAYSREKPEEILGVMMELFCIMIGDINTDLKVFIKIYGMETPHTVEFYFYVNFLKFLNYTGIKLQSMF